MADEEDRKLITPEEAGRRLSLDLRVKNVRDVVLRMARKGQLRSVRVGNFRMIEVNSIQEFIDGRVEQPGRIKPLRAVR